MNLSIRDLNQISVNTYNCCALAYEERFMDITPYKKSVDEFYSHITPKKPTILDVGCGPGNYSYYLSQKSNNATIHGIDLSEEMVKLAQKHVTSGDFKVADIRKFKYPRNFYDGLVASFCIPYLSNDETSALIAQFSKTLKSSGVLYLSCMEGVNSGFEKTSFSGEMAVYIYYFKEDFLVDTLEENGFRLISLYKQDYAETDGTFLTDIIIIAQKIY